MSEQTIDKPTILVIEDSEAFSLIITRQLKNKYNYKVASSGADGLTKAKTLKPDLILLDIEMPGYNGIDVLREIKRLRIPTRVIMLTIRGEPETIVECMRLGASNYITKKSLTDTDNPDLLIHRIEWALAADSTLKLRVELEELQLKYQDSQQAKAKFEQETERLRQENSQMQRIVQLQEQLNEHAHRLHLLKLQQARQGINTSPEVITEIENIEKV